MYTDDDDSLKQSAGSPAFLAPELCSAGTVPHGKLVDIWALGVTLYCFIFGKVPFMAENVLDIYEKIRTEPYVFIYLCCQGCAIAWLVIKSLYSIDHLLLVCLFMLSGCAIACRNYIYIQ